MPKQHYIALGDCLTVGVGGSSRAATWPHWIAQHIVSTGGTPVNLVNLAEAPATTAKLLAHQLPAVQEMHPDCISIQIGWNDLLDGFDEPYYHARMVEVYDQLTHLGLPSHRILAVSLPDYFYSAPAVRLSRGTTMSNTIRRFNAAAHVTAQLRGFTWVDIFDRSIFGIGRSDWVAHDQCHPGDAQYQAWADYIWATAGASWLGTHGAQAL